jgi:ABC-type polysaccharide/polyol phosphate export permease
MLLTSYQINWLYVLTIPLLLIFAFIFGVGCTFFLSSIAVYVRDIQYALGPMGIAFFIMTPMRYMAEDATGLLGTLIWYNPLTYYIEWNHQILYWGIAPSLDYVIICALLAILMLIIGYAVFKKLKSGFVKRL